MAVKDVKIFESEIAALGEGDEIIAELKKAANEVAGRVNAPKHLTVRVKAGKSQQGAFSQVIMRGRGAIAIEFGTKTMRASSPLRRALGGGA